MMLLLLENKLQLAPIGPNPQVGTSDISGHPGITDFVLEDFGRGNWNRNLGNACPMSHFPFHNSG